MLELVLELLLCICCHVFENIGYIQLLKEENKRKIYIITQKGKERLELEKEKIAKTSYFVYEKGL